MSTSLPTRVDEIMSWQWSAAAERYQALLDQPLTAETCPAWLADWTALAERLSERFIRLRIATNQDTTDQSAEAAYNQFLDQVYPAWQALEQKMKEKLLASGLEPDGMQVPLRKLRTDAALFRAENLPLLAAENKLGGRYNKIIGAQTVEWQGQELTLQQIKPLFYDPDRSVRESLWRLAAERQLADREAIDGLWQEGLDLRRQLAANAGLPDYRAYRWQQMLRLDYTPADCLQFQQAILETAVPAATRVYARACQRLGVDSLRPWDLDADLYPLEQPQLPGYGSIENLQATAGRIFYKVLPRFGDYFDLMRRERLLDLDNRKGKAPGGYCTGLPVSRRMFIFMNAVGVFSDVRTALHEAGHAFHGFEAYNLPYNHQRHAGLEFAEVASMAMELLTYPYMDAAEGGFFSAAETRRAKVTHLERILTFWPYMAVVDAFQHWAYTHLDEARDPAHCDAVWLELWQRYLPGVDWSGLDAVAMTGWQRKQHIFRYPFYYVEYGVAQMGAVQVWRGALQDQTAAVERYRQALALGGTRSLPDLYAAAGGKFAFDSATLGAAVDLVESQIAAFSD